MTTANIFPLVISINFSQVLYSAKEADGIMIITLEADGYSTWPFFAVVKPTEVANPGNLIN